MPAGNMAKLVRQHALHFVGRFGRAQQSGMNEDALSASDESIDGIVVHEHDLDRAFAQACGFGQRIDHVLQQGFGFGIAQHADALRGNGLRHHGGQRDYGQQPCENVRNHAHRVGTGLAARAVNGN